MHITMCHLSTWMDTFGSLMAWTSFLAKWHLQNHRIGSTHYDLIFDNAWSKLNSLYPFDSMTHVRYNIGSKICSIWCLLSLELGWNRAATWIWSLTTLSRRRLKINWPTWLHSKTRSLILVLFYLPHHKYLLMNWSMLICALSLFANWKDWKISWSRKGYNWQVKMHHPMKHRSQQQRNLQGQEYVYVVAFIMYHY